MVASCLPAKVLEASRECRLPCLPYGIGTLRFYCEAMKRRAFTKDDLPNYRSFPSIQLRLVEMDGSRSRTVESQWVNPDYAIADPPQGVVKPLPHPMPKPVRMNAIVKPPQGVVTPAPISRPERSVVIRPTRSVLRISQ